jgi:exopolysaccharide biosynthesis polyprenyl glycosylphosphotransferase
MTPRVQAAVPRSFAGAVLRVGRPANPVPAFLNAAAALLALLAVFAGVNWHRMPDGFGEFLALRVTVRNLIKTPLFLLGWAAVFGTFAKVRTDEPLRTEMSQVTKACLAASVFALLFPLTSDSGLFGYRVVAYFLPVSMVVSLGGRLVARGWGGRIVRALVARRDVIIVGSGPRAAGLYDHLRALRQGAPRVLGFVDSPNGHPLPPAIRGRMLGKLIDLEGILMSKPVDEVLIALPAKSCYDQIQTAILTCERIGVKAKYLSDVFELSLARPRFEPDDRAPLVSLPVVQDDYRLAVKRCIDIVGAAAGLVLLAPVMLAVAAMVRWTSPGPVVFAQERFGLNRRRFRMYKFRTMVENAEGLQAQLEDRNEARGPVFKIRDDPRITPVGRFLRRTSLDELPQLLNVLKGEMSLVGPRPLPKRDVSRFEDASLMRRFSVKPGLTCLWQVSGRSNADFDEWIRMDLEYIDNWSLTLDLRILVQTIPAVLRGTGAV